MSEREIVATCGQPIMYDGATAVVLRHDSECPHHVESPDSLDAAWAEAEAALPEGWEGPAVQRSWAPTNPPTWGRWWARAGRLDERRKQYIGEPVEREDGYGETPAAALRALAAKLRERAG